METLLVLFISLSILPYIIVALSKVFKNSSIVNKHTVFLDDLSVVTSEVATILLTGVLQVTFIYLLIVLARGLQWLGCSII